MNTGINNSMRRVIAVDYGSKRIGIAVSDPLRLFPSKTFTLNNDKNYLSELLKIISENEADTIILGYPENSGKSTNKFTEKILKLKDELQLKSHIRVELWDEQLTSKMAEERIITSVTKKSKRQNKSLVDEQAAAIILEEYLRSKENN